MHTLVEYGASFDHVDMEGDTLLMMCCHVEVAEYVLSLGTDINHINKQGVTVLMNAINQRSVDLTDFTEAAKGGG